MKKGETTNGCKEIMITFNGCFQIIINRLSITIHKQ